MKSLDDIRNHLLELRSGYSSRIEAIQQDSHHKDEPVEKDFAEQATQSENDDVLAALDDEAQIMIMHIDAALSRINQGTYGVCTACGENIAAPRLEALPFAELCISCAEKSGR